jgi:hypothetical protein
MKSNQPDYNEDEDQLKRKTRIEEESREITTNQVFK